MESQRSLCKVKHISECFITPKSEINRSKNPYYLSPIDLRLLSSSYMHKGLLYNNNNNTESATNNHNIVPTLKEAISHALVHFYPLAGRLATVEYPDEHACWIHVDFINNKQGSGARYIHAIAEDVTISDILSHEVNMPSYVFSFFELGDKAIVNHDGHTRALVSVQVTELIDGVFIGFTINHSICDGSSCWHFINSVSEIFMKLSNSLINNLNTISISRTPIFEPISTLIKLPYLDPSEFISRQDLDPRLRMKTFHFSATTIAKLKAQANEENELVSSDRTKTISSFQALCAFVWTSITRARNMPLDSQPACWLAANLRSRLNEPRLTDDHFGNHITWIKASTNASELLNNDLSWAADLLHNAVVSLDVEAVQTHLKALVDKPSVPQRLNLVRDKDGYNPILFTGSIRFNIYGPEFGFGQAVTICSGYPSFIDGNVKCNPGREGGGSVDLDICLFSETMTNLESDHKFMRFVTRSRW